MMRFKKKKVRKQRGSTYHGWGRGASHHKGAGNRGGRGRAGTGKRADAKKPSFWKEPTGKRGFTSKSRMAMKAINLVDVYDNLAEWVNKGFASKTAAGYDVDLKKAGYDKLLGTGEAGEFKEKLFIITDFASINSVAKVKEAGGEVKVLKTIVKKEKKKPVKHKKAENSEKADEVEAGQKEEPEEN
ncbi:uL15 family ribosomal protein [Candidatus Woesearchaeota archaeon]|nr:uL15 family ribosomal protein [Candidatus Woesearchaeota archaeon]